MRALLAGLILALACAFPAAAHPPRGIVVDGQGQVYFSDLTSIWKVDAQGRVTRVRPPGERHTHEIAIDRLANVYGEDSYYDPATQVYRAALWRITPQGRFGFLLAPTASPPVGASIWRDAAGRTYLVDQAAPGSPQTLVLRRAPDGTVTRLLGDPDAVARYRPELLSNVSGAAFGPHGVFYFRHKAVLRKLTPQGRIVTLARDLAPENYGIAVDASGAVFVAEFAGRRVLKLTPDGRRSVAVASEAPWAPTGVAVGGRTLYVLEARHRRVTDALRVRRVSADGRSVTLATVPIR